MVRLGLGVVILWRNRDAARAAHALAKSSDRFLTSRRRPELCYLALFDWTGIEKNHFERVKATRRKRCIFDKIIFQAKPHRQHRYESKAPLLNCCIGKCVNKRQAQSFIQRKLRVTYSTVFFSLQHCRVPPSWSRSSYCRGCPTRW